MNRDQTKQILKILQQAFPRFEIVNNSFGVDVWTRSLEDLEYEKAEKATYKCLKENEFPPSIAEIRKAYDVIAAAEKHELGEIRRFYEQARSFYPGCREVGYGWKEFVARVKTKEDAEKLQNLIIGYVHQAEKDGNVIDFAECVKTVRYDMGNITVENVANSPVDERK